jgi:hypothetical protein
MKCAPANCDTQTRFQLRFRCLLDAACSCAFPCDAAGRVSIDSLGERDRISYLFARTLVGRDFAAPQVLPLEAA